MSEPIARLIEVARDRSHELELGTFVIGRELDADVSIDHPDVSRRHAELTIGLDGATIRDLDSKNGLTVEGRKLGRGSLNHGARFSLGKLELVYEHFGPRVDQLIARSGEVTIRRPPAPAPEQPRPRSPVLPALAALIFALLIVALVVLQ